MKFLNPTSSHVGGLCRGSKVLSLIAGVSFTFFGPANALAASALAANALAASALASAPVGLEDRAQGELAIGAGHVEDPFVKKPRRASKSSRGDAKVGESSASEAAVLAPQAEVATVIPQTDLKSIEPEGWAWSLGLRGEVWQPSLVMELGNGQQVDFRDGRLKPLPALSFELGLDDLGRAGNWGAYLGLGYTQSKINYRSPIGFLYDDVQLHALRAEAGLRVGVNWGAWSSLSATKDDLSLRPATGATLRALSLQLKAGAGRMSWMQTSRYSEIAGSADQNFIVGGADLQWAMSSRWSAVIGAAYRRDLRNRDSGLNTSAQAGSLSLNEWNWSGGLVGSL